MGQRVEVTIEKLVHGGDGLARLPAAGHADARHQAVFVPFTLPGERVAVELDPPRRGRTTARLIEVLEAAPERVSPACEYFGRCGGCQLQHARSASQLELKRGVLLETLQRTGGIAWTGPVEIHAGPPWGYRNRIRLHAVPPARADDPESPASAGWGYTYAGSRRILPVTHCPIASAGLNDALRHGLPRGLPGEEVELAVNNLDEGLAADGPLAFTVGAYCYRVSPGSFFQVNRYLTAELVAAVTGGVHGTSALDLFSGVGLFTLPLAERFERVEAVESHPAAAADLRHNAAGDSRIRTVAQPVLAFLKARPAAPVDLIVADPPRAGLGPELVQAMLAAEAERLCLVSCDPATLGRDLRGLLAAGYAIEAVHLFDLFPQTYHLETVIHLQRRQPE